MTVYDVIATCKARGVALILTYDVLVIRGLLGIPNQATIDFACQLVEANKREVFAHLHAVAAKGGKPSQHRFGTAIPAPIAGQYEDGSVKYVPRRPPTPEELAQLNQPFDDTF